MAKKDWMLTESELDDDQLLVLNAILDKSCIVEGCAGSGKSVLALIKAQRIQKEKGDNYEIIVFTKTLCRYMNAGREQLGLHRNFTYYWNWEHKLNKPHADYIIVDEIQDFDKDEINDLIGAADKEFFFFGDTAQSIYEGLKVTVPVGAIPRLLPFNKNPKTFSLYRNYRLPLPVARFVQYVGVSLDPFNDKIYKSPEKEMPRLLKYDTGQQQLEAIASIIKTNSFTDVGILLPENDQVKSVSNKLRELGLNVERRFSDKEDWHNNVDSLNFTTTNPKVMTYHSAKGLQFETVFLPMISDCIVNSDRKALYVAMTRTCRNLYIMYSGNMPSPLDTIPSSLYKTVVTDEIEDI